MDNKTYSIAKTNFAAINNALILDVRELNTCLITFTGTYSFTAQFEGSDDNGTTWYAISAAQTNTNTVATSHAVANATQAYELSCHAFTTVRVRLSAFTSAGTHKVTITGTSMAVEPAPVVQAAPSQTIATPTGSAISVTTTASTNASVQKASSGNLFEISVANVTATPCAVKVYDKASAPTVGTDVPILTIPAPAYSTVAFNFGQIGKRLTSGIALAITANTVATDTAVAVAGVQVHGTYI